MSYMKDKNGQRLDKIAVPDATVVAATYETLTASRAPVRKRTLPARGSVLGRQMPGVYAPPITMSAPGAASSIANPQEYPLQGGIFNLTGSVPTYTAIGDGSYATGTKNGTTGTDIQYNLLLLAFETDAPTVEITFWDDTQSFFYRVKVNGEWVTAVATSYFHTNTGTFRRMVIPLGSRKWREIVLETQNMAIKQVTVGKTDTIKAAQPKPFRLGYITDSYGIYSVGDGIFYTASQLLGVDTIVDSSGGTGYVATSGTRPAIGARLPSLLGAALDGIVYAVGINDYQTATATVVAAAQAAWQQALTAGIPAKYIWVLAPHYSPLRGALTSLRDALKTAAVGMGLNFIDNLAENWITGTGANSTRTVTDGVLNSTTTLTSATGAFTVNDVGDPVSGTGIPAGTTIQAYVSATQVTLSAAATATATGVTVTISTQHGDGNADIYIGSDWLHPVQPDGFTYLGVRLAESITASAGK